MARIRCTLFHKSFLKNGINSTLHRGITASLCRAVTDRMHFSLYACMYIQTKTSQQAEFDSWQTNWPPRLFSWLMCRRILARKLRFGSAVKLIRRNKAVSTEFISYEALRLNLSGYSEGGSISARVIIRSTSGILIS